MKTSLREVNILRIKAPVWILKVLPNSCNLVQLRGWLITASPLMLNQHGPYVWAPSILPNRLSGTNTLSAPDVWCLGLPRG